MSQLRTASKRFIENEIMVAKATQSLAKMNEFIEFAKNLKT